MNRNAILSALSIAALAWYGFSCSSVSVAAKPSKEKSATAASVVKIKLGSQPSIVETESNRIKQLIQELATIDKPNFGLNGTLSGSGFAPFSSAYRVDSGLIMNHGFGTNAAFIELVKLGPKALPFLLDSISDPTPTKLDIRHDGFFGGMFFANELSGNPANTYEQEIISRVPRRDPWSSENRRPNLTNYTVRVGDVCFVIIGQIVGREYQAARYQPTSIVILNSPVEDEMLAKQVRAIWGSTNPPQHLLDSLLLDYAAGKDSGRRGFGDAAAMRLVYYFPQQTTNLLVSNLQLLDIGKGTGSKDLIEMLSLCEEPTIRDELRDIFEHTENINVLCAAVRAVDESHRQAARLRMESFLDRLPKQEDEYYGDGFNLLVALGEKFGADAKPAFESYLKQASMQRVVTVTDVLERTQGQWSIDLLAPYLTDTREPGNWSYPSFPKEGEKQRPIRVCDLAAGTIAFNFRKLSFEMKGEHKDLDAQIEVMRQKIAASDFR
jgi:hypothetical protein